MNKLTASLCLLLVSQVLSGCSSPDNTAREEAVEKVSAPFANGAITIQLRAEPKLNLVNGMPNSCMVLLLQAKDKAALDKILSNPIELKSLFSGAGGESDVLQVDRYPMMPGQTNTMHIDRAMNTRHVALVAGYYPFPTKQHIVILDVPVETHSTGWWSTKWHASLTPIIMTVTLGSESIVEAQSNVKSAFALESADSLVEEN